MGDRVAGCTGRRRYGSEIPAAASDVVPETLGKIAVMLGARLLPEILKQMQAALLQEPQLHILAFVTHSLLVLVTSPENLARFDNLDPSVAIVGHIAAEVIFGQSSRDEMTHTVVSVIVAFVSSEPSLLLPSHENVSTSPTKSRKHPSATIWESATLRHGPYRENNGEC